MGYGWRGVSGPRLFDIAPPLFPFFSSISFYLLLFFGLYIYIFFGFLNNLIQVESNIVKENHSLLLSFAEEGTIGSTTRYSGSNHKV